MPGSRFTSARLPQTSATAPKLQGVRMYETTIGADRWALNNLDATTGVQVLTRILGIVGPPVGALAPSLAGATTGALDFKFPVDALSLALGALMQGLADPEASTVEIVKTLLGSLHKGSPLALVNFDEEFASRYWALTRVIGWALTINYGDFFVESPVAAGLVSKVKAAALKASTKEPSTGESGA